MRHALAALVAVTAAALTSAGSAEAAKWQEAILRMPVYDTPAVTQSYSSYESYSYAPRARKSKRARKSAWKAQRSITRRSSSKRTRVASLGNSYSYSSSSGSYSSGGGGSSSGLASYYWQPQRVASGGWFNPNALTAAHKTLPFGTKVRVTNVRNGRSVVVTINDRGPFVAGRVIDLSKAAAGVIGMQSAGVVPVRITRL
ncbi:MAG: septal ring lytic transglycosylase RlpA family protein [Hyphomicrobiaceae bacterium]